MKDDANAALFVLLGQSAEKAVRQQEDVVPDVSLLISPQYDLALLLPEQVRRASKASEAYRLFFVFEGYLRDFVVDVLTKSVGTNWWSSVPTDVQTEVAGLEETEEVKSWMAIGSRDKSALMTFPQLLRVIDHCWKNGFDEIVRDKGLIQEARLIGHLRNTICHMSEISEEEEDRIRQVMRDWFRIVAP